MKILLLNEAEEEKMLAALANSRQEV